MKTKTKNPDITFKDVFDIYGNELVITGTCLNKAKTVYFHYSTHPEEVLLLRLAVF